MITRSFRFMAPTHVTSTISFTTGWMKRRDRRLSPYCAPNCRHWHYISDLVSLFLSQTQSDQLPQACQQAQQNAFLRSAKLQRSSTDRSPLRLCTWRIIVGLTPERTATKVQYGSGSLRQNVLGCPLPIAWDQCLDHSPSSAIAVQDLVQAIDASHLTITDETYLGSLRVYSPRWVRMCPQVFLIVSSGHQLSKDVSLGLYAHGVVAFIMRHAG